MGFSIDLVKNMGDLPVAINYEGGANNPHVSFAIH